MEHTGDARQNNDCVSHPVLPVARNNVISTKAGAVVENPWVLLCDHDGHPHHW